MGNRAISSFNSRHWKGQRASYRALHIWIAKIRGKAFFCEECGLDEVPVGKKRYFQWANISGNYLRIVEDWKQLCIKCHTAFDERNSKQGIVK